jgi:hypothetical protein
MHSETGGRAGEPAAGAMPVLVGDLPVADVATDGAAGAGGGWDWSRFGRLLPVLRAEREVGASLTALAVADALAGAGYRVLLLDVAHPLFSGLGQVATSGWLVPSRGAVGLGVRHARRGEVRLAALDQGGCPMSPPESLPDPGAWMPPEAAASDGGASWSPQVTVIDVGWDPAALADPQAAPRVWLHPGTPQPCPLLVTQPSKPGLAAAERACEALGAAAGDGQVSPVARLVLAGAEDRACLVGAGGERVAALAEHAIFLPYDPQIATAGLGVSPVSARLQAALASLTGVDKETPRAGQAPVWPLSESDHPAGGSDHAGGSDSDRAGLVGEHGDDEGGGELGEGAADPAEPGGLTAAAGQAGSPPPVSSPSRAAGPAVDLAATWDAGSAIGAGVTTAGREAPTGQGVSLAKAASAAVAALRESSLRLAAAVEYCAAQMPSLEGSAVDWSAFGRVIPVLGTGQSGASVTAVAIAEAAAAAGWRVLLVDQADPACSGLSRAAAVGAAGREMAPGLRVRHTTADSHRGGQVRLASLDVDMPVAAAGAVPGPHAWLSPEARDGGGWRPQVTVVDIGWDATRVAACPWIGAGQWLRAGAPMPAPVLAVRPTLPGLEHGELVAARLSAWVGSGDIAPLTQLVVSGARRWPKSIVGASGPHLAGLVDEAVFLLGDDDLALSGVTEAPLPERLRKPAAALLQRCAPDVGGAPDTPGAFLSRPAAGAEDGSMPDDGDGHGETEGWR